MKNTFRGCIDSEVSRSSAYKFPRWFVLFPSLWVFVGFTFKLLTCGVILGFDSSLSLLGLQDSSDLGNNFNWVLLLLLLLLLRFIFCFLIFEKSDYQVHPTYCFDLDLRI